MSDEVPDWAKLWLDEDVAAWLHRYADEMYEGDVGKALNEVLRWSRGVLSEKLDAWASLEGLQRGRGAARRPLTKPRTTDPGG